MTQMDHLAVRKMGVKRAHYIYLLKIMTHLVKSWHHQMIHLSDTNNAGLFLTNKNLIQYAPFFLNSALFALLWD